MKYNWQVVLASNFLRQDKIVVHATESVFGIAASVYSAKAIADIKSIKARGSRQHLLVIVANLEQACSLICLDVPYREQVMDSWPGHTSWVLPASEMAPRWLLDESGFIGVRMTAHSQASKLCCRAGPLVSTSANTKGNPPALMLRQARKYFGRGIDYYLPGELGLDTQPSRIQNGVTGKIIRA